MRLNHISFLSSIFLHFALTTTSVYVQKVTRRNLPTVENIQMLQSCFFTLLPGTNCRVELSYNWLNDQLSKENVSSS